MARIRTVKPAFFRHERLQQLEQEHMNLRPMLVFEGLWTQADRDGRFEWRPRMLKLDILPFVDFEMGESLELLRANGFIERYEVGEQAYGYIPTWHEHQRPHRQEPSSRIPSPPDANPNPIGDSLMAIRQSPTTGADGLSKSLSSNEIRESPKPVRESPNGFDGEGRMGRENGKGNGATVPGPAEDFSPTPEDLPPLVLARSLIETLNTPHNASLQTQVSECIQAKARESGMSFAEAHDYIRDKAAKAKPSKWLFWFRDAQYNTASLPMKGETPCFQGPVKRAADDLPLSQKLAREEGGAANAH